MHGLRLCNLTWVPCSFIKNFSKNEFPYFSKESFSPRSSINVSISVVGAVAGAIFDMVRSRESIHPEADDMSSSVKGAPIEIPSMI